MSHDLQSYPGYKDEELALLKQFQNEHAVAEPGFITDFIGTRTRIGSVYAEARSLENRILGLPVPSNFHAEAIEWIGALKAVVSARDQFVVVEFGAGYGTWCVGTAVAARSRAIERIRIHGVEADPQHFASMEQHCRDNGFDPAEHHLLLAAVGTTDGTARWPKIADTSGVWGLRLTPDDQVEYTGGTFAEFMEVRVVAMAAIIQHEALWDLVHIDVQGHEVDICRSCLVLLNERVRWIVVGTHSRKLDGDMLDMMYRAGWILENEKPTRFTFVSSAPTLEGMALFDGTQVWRNPRLP